MPENKISVAGRAAAVAGLALTLALPLLHGNQFGERYLGLSPLQSRDLFWWPMLAVTLAYVVFVERRPLSSIGIRKLTWQTFVYAFVATAIALFAVLPLAGMLATLLHVQSSPNVGAAQAIMNMPVWYRVTLVTRAALVEEVIFRGYAIERIEELTGSRLIAGALSLTAFVAVHLSYWGWAPLIGVAAVGLILTLLYLWRRDLVCNSIAHFTMDAVQILL